MCSGHIRTNSSTESALSVKTIGLIKMLVFTALCTKFQGQQFLQHRSLVLLAAVWHFTVLFLISFLHFYHNFIITT